MGRYDTDTDIDEVDESEEVQQPKVVVSSAPRTIKRGWAAAENTKSASSIYAQNLKLTEDPVIIKFLEDEPYASFRQHWLSDRKGQKSFTCIADMEPKGCPLCAMGDRPATRFAFNVALLERNSEAVIRSYEVGPRVIDQLKNFHTDPRQGPLTKHFWAVSRTGKGTTSATHHQLVKERDLAEEWDVTALDESEIAALRAQAYGPEIIQISDYRTLQSIALEEQEY